MGPLHTGSDPSGNTWLRRPRALTPVGRGGGLARAPCTAAAASQEPAPPNGVISWRPGMTRRGKGGSRAPPPGARGRLRHRVSSPTVRAASPRLERILRGRAYCVTASHPSQRRSQGHYSLGALRHRQPCFVRLKGVEPNGWGALWDLLEGRPNEGPRESREMIPEAHGIETPNASEDHRILVSGELDVACLRGPWDTDMPQSIMGCRDSKYPRAL